MLRDELEAALRHKAKAAASIGATILFDLGSDGSIFLDGKASPATVAAAGPAPDTTITVSAADLKELMAGELNPMEAYSTGRLDVLGDINAAMKLSSLLS